MVRTAGSTDRAPKPAGPYSQSVRIGNVVACAGAGGISPQGDLREGIEAQTRQTFDNLVTSLTEVGATTHDVIQVRVFLTDLKNFAAMNSVYAEYFTDPYPARTTVYVQLPPGMLVEIDALAVLE
jgi:2-iminobutanoate/2-iminopropanoate deaminase